MALMVEDLFPGNRIEALLLFSLQSKTSQVSQAPVQPALEGLIEQQEA